jgi:hypothetical protein
VRGRELTGDLVTLEKYLRMHHLLLMEGESSNTQLVTSNIQKQHQGGSVNDKDKDNNKDNNKDNKDGAALSYSPQRESGQGGQWIEMTQYGLGRYDRLLSPYTPVLRLTDALMSLNYLITTGITVSITPTIRIQHTYKHPSPFSRFLVLFGLIILIIYDDVCTSTSTDFTLPHSLFFSLCLYTLYFL